MTLHVRIRLLLVAAVAILGIATWLDVDAQRAQLLDRQGQEEFVLLLPDTDAAGASAVAEKLRETLASVSVPSVPSGITASFGVAALPEHARDADGLLRAADRALYAAKQAGRNRVELAAAADAPVA